MLGQTVSHFRILEKLGGGTRQLVSLPRLDRLIILGDSSMNQTQKLSLRKCLNIRLLTILFISLGCGVVTASALTGPTHCRTMVRAGETGGASMPGSGQNRIRAGAAIAGTWNWVSGQILVIHPDGAFEVFEEGGKVNQGHWENLEGRRYRLHHRYGGYIDTVTLSDDGNALDGTNNFGSQLHGSRE